MRELRASFQTAEIVAHAVLEFELEEALGVPARATVSLHFNEYVDPDALLGTIGTLRFGHEVLEHSFAGVVTAATWVATTKAGSENIWPVRVEVASQLAILEHSVTSRIFQDLSVPDIVGVVLSEHGIPEGRQQWNLSASYPKREYCVQYGESALAF